MKFKPFTLNLFSFLLLFSCSSGHDKQKNPIAQAKDTIVKEQFETGKIIDVTCKNDPSQSYAMYLPANYSIEKTFPIIIAFDAHGTGRLPVSLYKDLAEQYGYIIIGTNNSKNGIPWEETKQNAGKLFADAGTRLSLDMKRIYLLGFSGGARVANGITITNGSIAGVICCGAAAPAINSVSPRNDYTFLGMIGNEDFNYIEMRKYDMIDIAGHNVKHGLITFDGKHEWPSKEFMADAFWWLQLNEMRKNSIPRNDSLLTKKLQVISDQLENYHQNNRSFEEYRLCQTTINFYSGLGDLSHFYDAYKALQSNADVDKALRQEEVMWKREETLKQYYLAAFQEKNQDWWQKDIASLRQKIKTEKDKEQTLVYKRTLNYLSLAIYMYASKTVQDNNMEAADHFCKLYVLVDPTNTEAHYLTAVVNAKKGNSKEAINSLSTAIKNGFDDKARLQNDNAFVGIKNMKEFEEIVGELK